MVETKFVFDNQVLLSGSTQTGKIIGYIIHKYDEVRYIVEYMDANSVLVSAVFPEHGLEFTN